MLTITTGHLSPSMDPTICTGSHHTGRQTSRQRMFHQHHDASKPHTRRTPGHKPNPFDLHSGNGGQPDPGASAHTATIIQGNQAARSARIRLLLYWCEQHPYRPQKLSNILPRRGNTKPDRSRSNHVTTTIMPPQCEKHHTPKHRYRLDNHHTPRL